MKNNLIFIILAILILGGTYFWYSNMRTPNPSAVSTNDPEMMVGQEFVQLVARMKGIKLNADFFTSPSFVYLEDMTPDVPYPTKIGKKDPFAMSR